MAVLEFKHGETERGKTLFEGLVDRSPKRLDLWSVYIDQLAKTGDIQGCRGLFTRALDQKLTAKKAKSVHTTYVSGTAADSAGSCSRSGSMLRRASGMPLDRRRRNSRPRRGSRRTPNLRTRRRTPEQTGRTATRSSA